MSQYISEGRRYAVEQTERERKQEADRIARLLKVAKGDPDLTTAQIGERFGMSARTVARILDANGVTVASDEYAGLTRKMPEAQRQRSNELRRRAHAAARVPK